MFFIFCNVMVEENLTEISPMSFFIFSPERKKIKYQKSKIVCYQLTALLNPLLKLSMVKGQLSSLFQSIRSTSSNKKVNVLLAPKPIPVFPIRMWEFYKPFPV